MKKIAVIFPGIGYHSDKPLLYYSKKLARSRDYEILELSYGNFPPGIKGDPEKMKEAFISVLDQAGQILSGLDFREAEDILFISKSIGTVAAAAYAAEKKLRVRHIYFTPLKETFDFAAKGNGIAFHGSKDPWAADEDIAKGCREKEIELVEISGANHSLETGDMRKDLKILVKVMKAAEDWLF